MFRSVRTEEGHWPLRCAFAQPKVRPVHDIRAWPGAAIVHTPQNRLDGLLWPAEILCWLETNTRSPAPRQIYFASGW